jgi:hypothetical protein
MKKGIVFIAILSHISAYTTYQLLTLTLISTLVNQWELVLVSQLTHYK